MKIIAVCGLGVGSSVIAKMNIESILSEEGKDEVDVDTVDLGSIRSAPADIYVTTRELFEDFPEEDKEKTIVLTNFVDKNDIKAHLDPKMAELENK
ncbi:MAG: PTS sugar transporter subunit IIB [Furfurilactobacillus sp.]|jgi:PTS system ascorbate-specific IIB component|uniref:PTS system, Lactose Cellobiose specific IIB subunit n=2 Tax=Furfurilactobacillus TaxID=2767882 RepID=A0A0R1RJY9_9LACO|nr:MULTISPECIES: PTS sugar transporter subunit IIB [Furfurilactobacillus]KRL54517.1 PTS system, Lactose Cellobiose specific IIB subunit [Furfurilactobacillus rossiae DSM 15814]MCF6165796.1 PTS sugar transporter subunit IIB [Furfurilactobacillus rossiae]MCF6418604.1 PTS sugar transporter subunit IIB [Furfurilactobacillus milii]MCH4012066.1 PTS sugar transporter subunit IIB [Furfurilactobacillus sp.]MCH4037958.1 PTS sugar transporter subunit IIB [Furfurilactobacillus sp.]